MNATHSMHFTYIHNSQFYIQNLFAKSKCIIYICICQPDNVMKNSKGIFNKANNNNDNIMDLSSSCNCKMFWKYSNVIFACILIRLKRKWYMWNIIPLLSFTTNCLNLPSSWVILAQTLKMFCCFLSSKNWQLGTIVSLSYLMIVRLF